MKKFKAVFFDIDDTLYNSTLQVDSARKNAIRAMIEAGLLLEEDKALELLDIIVKEFGSNFDHHYDELLKRVGVEDGARLVAAGIIAYHATKAAYLVPFPDTVPTLIRLIESGIKVGVITDGVPVKQWEKLVRLGLQHFFDSVVISNPPGPVKPDVKVFENALAEVKVKPGEALMVGDRLDKDIRGGNDAGLVTVQLLKGKHSRKKPRNDGEEPDYIIERLRDILPIVGIL